MTKNWMLVCLASVSIAATALVLAGCSDSGCSMHGGNAGTTAATPSCHGSGGNAAQAKSSAADSSAKFANTHCPIMGGKIDPSKVSDSLVREYKGKRIAFCCGGCPAQWDRLSDAQKDAKLRTN